MLLVLSLLSSYPLLSFSSLCLQIAAFSAEVPAAATIFPFLLEQGVVDIDEGVRQAMVNAGMALISTYGSTDTASLLSIFDGVLEAPPPPKGQDVRPFDWRREGAVVFMGSTAKHLNKDDPKVRPCHTEIHKMSWYRYLGVSLSKSSEGRAHGTPIAHRISYIPSIWLFWCDYGYF